MAQIQTVVYSKELQKQLFPDNAFYKKSISESGLAADAKTFEIPVLGNVNAAKMQTLETTLPLTITRSNDDKVTGTMHLLYCDPILVEDEEEIVVNYDKRRNKQLQQAAALNTFAADYAAKQWLPTTAGNIIDSTGSNRATGITGLTGNRKAVTKADMLKVYRLLIRMNVKEQPGGFYGLVTPDCYTDLLTIPDFVDYEKTGNVSRLESGILGRICGIEIMVRSSGGSIGAWYNASDSVISETGTAETDRPANLFWHERFVCHAEAHAKTFIKADDPAYLGTIINSTVRFGAEKCRTDETGTVAIAEAV